MRVIFEIGSLRIDPEKGVISHAGEPQPVGAKVVATLAALCEQPGSIVSKEQLIAQTWPGQVVDETSLWQNIYVLRSLLRRYAGGPGIENVRGRGYRLVLPVSCAVAFSVPGAFEAASNAAPPQQRRAWHSLPWRGLFVACLCVTVFLGSSSTSVRHGARVSAEGARLYELGRYYWSRRTEVALLHGRRMFQQEINLDPQSALGYAGLADVDQTLCIMWGPSPSATSFMLEARRATQRAIALEPGSAEAQTSFASIQEMVHDRYGVADAHYLAALSANPQYAPAHLRYGVSLLLRRRIEPAIAHLRRAAALDPASVITNGWLATALYFDRQPLAATTYANEMKYLGDNTFDATSTLGLIYAEEKHYAAARRAFASLHSCCPIIAAALLAQVDAQSGRAEQARAELPTAQQAARAQIWVDVAYAQILLNERSAALVSLQRAQLTQAMDRSLVALDPRMQSVRNDRRFVKFFQE